MTPPPPSQEFHAPQPEDEWTPEMERELRRACLKNWRSSQRVAPGAWRLMFQVLIEETERLP